MLVRVLYRAAPAAADCFQRCQYASSAATDEILHYISSPAAKDNPEQAIDILRSGLSHQAGAQAGRLHLALADIALERSSWADAVSSALAAGECASISEAAQAEEISLGYDLQQVANEAAVRAALTEGEDENAIAFAKEGLRAAQRMPNDQALLSQRWQHLTESTARLGLAQLAAGQALEAQSSMQEVANLADNKDPGVGPLHGSDPDMSALPMMPRDMHISAALHRYGSWAYTQGNIVNATRYLQRAAMAAEAAIVQAEDEKQILLNGLTLRETMLAAFSGHVQTKLGRARDQKSWKQAELQLETTLERAEGVSGAKHPRIIPTLIHLGEVYAHTQRVTLAEGLYRNAAQMLYRNPTADTAFVPRQRPLPVHPSLAALLAWRYAQLLTALPKRDSEARQWRQQAETCFTESSIAGPIEQLYGDMSSLKGEGSRPSGVYVDNALRRVIPCSRPLVGEANDAPDS